MEKSSQTTVQLQALLDRQDEQAYEELLTIAAERLEKLARKMFRDYPRLKRWEQTDDIFQAATLRLHQSLTKVRPESVRQFFGLAATQIRRTLIDLARSYYGPAGTGANHDSSPQHVQGDSEQGDSGESPDKLAEWAEFHEQVENLAAEEREVFQLLWYSGTTQREAAELLKLSERTVLRRYQSAKLSLQKSLYGNS